MFRPRHSLNPSNSSLHLLIKPTHYSQLRYKTIKHVYKGEQPRRPKKPAPAPAPAHKLSKPEVKPIPAKKPKDPLQGMREANERERLRKLALKANEVENAVPPESTASSKEKSPSETTKTENEPEQQSTPLDSPQEAHQSAEPPSEPNLYSRPPPRGPPRSTSEGGGQKWMYYAAALTLAGAGLYLYTSTPKTDSPLTTKDLSDPSRPTPANVAKAIRLLKAFFKDRCSTLDEDLDEFGGEGIMGVGEGRKPRIVVWPENTEEVEIILNIAENHGVAVIPHSGGTSLEGQCVPVNDAITISLTRMDKIIEFRPRDMDITLQPGISWTQLNEFLKPYKLFLPVDPGPNAHIGGMISTSASGTNAVKYGTMKDWVLNLTVVLPGGHVMKTRSRARKSSTGYDLTRLFCGSEGTLGVITEVTLKLAHLPEKEVVGAIAFETNTAAANAVSKLIASGIEPRCVELLDTTCISAVNNSISRSIPQFPLKPHIFFKLSGPSDIIPQQRKQLTSVLTRAGGKQLRIARTEKEAEELWDIRRTLVYSLLAMFPGSEVIATDVCVPVSRLPGLIEQYKLDQEKVNSTIEGEGKKLASLIAGHVGDGNFHSMIAFEKGNAELKKKAEELEAMLVMNALALDGTCSGEHGVGIHKLRFMDSEYDDKALTLMRAIKAGIDPKGIMNPGTLLPPPTSGELSPRTSTINIESLNEWVVKPKSLDDPVETDPQLHSIAENGPSGGGEAWHDRVWNGIKGWGVVNSFTGSPPPKKLDEKKAMEVWADQGDGV